MSELFDTGGNALETTTVTVYGFTHETGEFQSSYDIRIIRGTGIPGCSTLLKPMKQKNGFVQVWRGGKWSYYEDKRGITVYSVVDGQSVTVDYLGPIADGYVITPPATPFDVWNGEAWVTDERARLAATVAENEKTREALLAYADVVTADWRTELALGVISDEDREKLTAWLAYKKSVKTVDITSSETPEWPEAPDDVA